MECYNSAVIKASAEKVFDTLKNFHDMSWSKNVVNQLDPVGDRKSDEVGAKRVLNGAFSETLKAMNPQEKSFSYSIDDGPGPLSKDNVDGYIGNVKVLPITEDNTSLVVWTCKWQRDKEGGVADFCNPIYHALLQDLKAHFST
ncbi:polyketide cyclase/dehydrase/lipid transport protein [Ulvibacter sp. MAR_2010_11]|uniref:SRPBCC family protein n=1 Tax=Ulvibacter sp. MAR_2010_11 TaxID=1250229 RepID=UPI000C2BBDDA|nr:SRPBCC family protein [Ulvibacter sp. MAR_2010_11]PKA82627.1 polyketide cyclase/dehydrase/lipid transport protein [Ulvibacter sp. MAR_2010_11]